MSVQTQTTYTARIRKGVAGMIPDQRDFTTDTKICRTSAGIGFGLAVSQVANDPKGVVLGGAAFHGISVRDVTLDGAPLDPLSSTRFAVDTYGLNQNMGVITRGPIFVQTMEEVNVGDPVAYNPTTGAISSTGETGAAAAPAAAGEGVDGANTGGGTCTRGSPAVLAGAVPGEYILKCTTAATGGGTFSVTNPDGVALPDAVVGTPYAHQIAFTIADGSPDFAEGDGFKITVSFSGGTNIPGARFEEDGTIGDIVLVYLTGQRSV